MALNWNQIAVRKATRTAMLSGNPIDSSPPTQTTPLGAVPKAPITEAEVVPEWRVEGVSPVTVDVISGKAPEPTPAPPLWASKDRPAGFAVEYELLDASLDGAFITDVGLTETKPGKWTPTLGDPEPL